MQGKLIDNSKTPNYLNKKNPPNGGFIYAGDIKV